MRIQLENRLIDFSVSVNNTINHLDRSLLSQTLGLQIIRSATSAALNFGEAQSAESRKDFIHKLSITLKELRETEINLKILLRSNSCKIPALLKENINESRQLIGIFQKSINTAKSRLNKQ